MCWVIWRLQTNLAFGGKDLTEEDYEKILIEGAAAQLSTKVTYRTSFNDLLLSGQASFQKHSEYLFRFDGSLNSFEMTVWCTDYLYEKIQDQLQDIADELTSEVNRNDEP